MRKSHLFGYFRMQMDLHSCIVHWLKKYILFLRFLVFFYVYVTSITPKWRRAILYHPNIHNYTHEYLTHLYLKHVHLNTYLRTISWFSRNHVIVFWMPSSMEVNMKSGLRVASLLLLTVLRCCPSDLLVSYSKGIPNWFAMIWATCPIDTSSCVGTDRMIGSIEL